MLARFAAPLRRAAAPRRCHRWLSTTLPRRASIPEFPPNFPPAAVEAIKRIKRLPMYQKFAANPESLEAFYKVMATIQAHRLDTDKPPSVLRLLLLKSEVREAIKELVDECEKLDIDLKDIIRTLVELIKLAGAVKK